MGQRRSLRYLYGFDTIFCYNTDINNFKVDKDETVTWISVGGRGGVGFEWV